jgi:thiosulfate/3-mercaptopyruvate sulfurtransferase
MATTARTIHLDELSARLGRPDLRILDARPLAAYNGWRLRGEPRGGHVPGAGALPAEWLYRLDDEDILALARAHDLATGTTTVVYGYDGAADRGGDARAVVDRLASIGVTGLRVIERGWTGGWAADASRPVELLPGYRRLVHPAWLREALDGGAPEYPPTGPLLLFHVNFGVPEEYAEGHLPGARYLDTNWLENPIDWNRRTPEELETALAGLGISHDATVVLYGRDTEGDANEKWPGRRAGQIAATRAALILRYAGVDDVRLLDGGYDRWVREGHPLEAAPRAPEPVAAFGRPIPSRPELIVDLDEAKEILADADGAALVSVRTWREHIGAVSGYNYIGPAGRIAGDVWGNCGSDAYHMQHYRAVDNTMRPYPEIAANWAAAGITPDKRVAFYCGTGWRASETWFYAWLQGWERIAVYDGGWFEWSRDPANNPIEVGEPGEPGDEAAA